MSVVSIRNDRFSSRLLGFIQYRIWEDVIEALDNGASPHVLVLPQMTFFEAYLRHLAKPTLFKAPERMDEEIVQRRVFHAFLSSWRGNNPAHKTPVSLATMMGRPDLLQALLDAGHDPNEMGGGHTPATILAAPVLEEVSRLPKSQRKFMEAGWDQDVRTGQMSCFRLLLAAGMDVNSHFSAGRSPLEWACLSKNIPIVLDLLNAGADPEGGTPEPLMSPLEIAIDTYSERATKSLLQHGANPLRAWSQEPYTGLPIASVACAEGMTSMLYDLSVKLGGIDHPALQKGWWLAIENGNSKVVGWFLDKGQDVKRIDETGSTALHIAVKSGNQKIIDRLVSMGLDFGAQDNSGISCRELFQQQHPRLAREVLGSRVGEPGNVIAFRLPRSG